MSRYFRQDLSRRARHHGAIFVIPAKDKVVLIERFVQSRSHKFSRWLKCYLSYKVVRVARKNCDRFITPTVRVSSSLFHTCQYLFQNQIKFSRFFYHWIMSGCRDSFHLKTTFTMIIKSDFVCWKTVTVY